MRNIAIEHELYQRVEKAAQEHQASVHQIVAEALHHYLWELDRRKISQESNAYHQRHPELKAQSLAQYIAMRDGQVVDHHSDFQVLRQRTRQRFGRAPMMITLVAETPEQPLFRRGFRIGATGS